MFWYEKRGRGDGSHAAMLNLVQLARFRAEESPDREAYVYLDKGEIPTARLTYGQLDRSARAIAAHLQSEGLCGERALLLFAPSIEYVAAFFGCLYAGVIAVPAYPSSRRHLDRLTGIIDDARPKAVLSGRELRATLKSVLDLGWPGTKPIWLVTEEIEAEDAGLWRPGAPDPERLAFLQYTSGSTGTPKGVMVSHSNLLANQALIQAYFGHSKDSTVVGWLPLYHDMGLIGNILQPFYTGATSVLMSPLAFMEKPLRWLEAISTYRAVTSGGPNFAYDLCVRKIGAEHKKNLDLSSWTLAFNGAEPVRPATMQRFSEAFAECGFRRASFFPCYGLAEATLYVAGGRWIQGEKHAEPMLPGLPSYGPAPKDHDIRVVDPETCEPLAENGVGEIWVAGPSVAQGYWNRPEESDRIFRARLNRAAPTAYLRTGDLGFLRGGGLYVTGRIKDLIIVRGRNYHPHDIEQILTDQMKDLRPGNCAAFSVPHEDGEALVVVAEVSREALLKPEFSRILSAMREILVEHCELAPADLVLVAPGSVPKTSSGKVRRQACKQDYLEKRLPRLAAPGEPLLTRASEAADGTNPLLREALRALSPKQRIPLVLSFLIAEVARLVALTQVRVVPDANLQSLGLDSLKTVELKHAVDDLIGCEFPLRLFLGKRTLAQLAEVLGEYPEPAKDLKSVTAESDGASGRSRAGSRDLSASQRMMWAVHGLESDGIGENLHLALRIEDRVDPGCLQRCLDRLLERHAVLRTVFRSDSESARPEILPPSAMPDYFHALDASDWSEDQLQRDFTERAREVFDLERGPLLRVVLYRHAEARTTLLFCAHHIEIDFWSLAIFITELEACYRDFALNREHRFSELCHAYVDYVALQKQYLQSAACETDWEYWRDRLEGELPIIALPVDRARPKRSSHAGASVAIRLDPETSRALKNLAKRCEVTLFSVLLAAYKVLLHRYTRSDDLIVGVPTSGRARSRFASVLGNFVNPLPVRSQPLGQRRFVDYLSEVHEAVTGALAHQDFPFVLMVERLRIERNFGRWPIYQTLFVLQQTQSGVDADLAQFALGEDCPPIALGEWQAQALAIHERIESFDLKLMAAETVNGVLLSFQYRSELFHRATIEGLALHFEELIAGILSEPKARLCELPLLSGLERRRMLHGWNSTRREYPAGLSVHRCFEIQVDRTPEAPALIFKHHRLSYRELNARANRVAQALIEAGIGPDVAVGLCMHRSLEMVIALLGILKAGGAFVPLEPDYPEERLAAMLEDARVRLILTRSEFSDRLANSGVPLRLLDSEGRVFSERDGSAGRKVDFNPGVPIDGANLAYVLFTSGSTGRPKGVGIPHKGLYNRLAWMQQRFGLDGTDAVLQKTPHTFDVSVWEFFWPLITGARLVLAAPGDHRDPERLVALIDEHRVSTLHFVPSMLAAFLDAADLNRCGALRRVIMSGEALSPELRDRFLCRSSAELHNLYGPTEASIDVTAWFCDRTRKEPSVPIGRPIANTQIYLLDEFLNPVPIGVGGELCIGGVQLARGYLTRAGLTAAAFVPNPFDDSGTRLYKTGDLARFRPDGTIEYLERIDQQVKIRGFRIELGEIERRLEQHAEVRDAVVLVREDGPGDRSAHKYLAAYVVPREAKEVELDGLKRWLEDFLPEYMIPAAFVVLDRLPVSANGKFDRKALPAPDFSARYTDRYAAPRNRTEACLAKIWAELLRVERIGVHDNFFGLGGDSILVIQAATRAREVGIVFTPRQLFEHQSVAELAAVAVVSDASGSTSNSLYRELRTGAQTVEAFSLAELDEEEIEALRARYADIEDVYPLAPMQEGLLFHSLLYPNSGIYVMQDRYRIEGSVEVEAFHEAWQAVADRHPILRTSFFWESRKRAHQIVHQKLRVPFEYFDWRHWSRHECEERLHRLLSDELREGFDFSLAPLFRIRLFRFDETHYRFVRSYHHVLLDEWCTSEILSHFLANYEALIRRRRLPDWQAPPFRDYIAWIGRQHDREVADFWRRELKDFTEPTPLAIDRPLAENAQAAGEIEDAIDFLPEADTRLLTGFAQRHRITVNTLLQAAWAMLLSHYSGRDDVVYGVTVAGRPVDLPGVEKILGLFINSLALRVKLSPGWTVTDFLKQLLSRNLELRQYEHTPLVAIQSWLGFPHERPLFDSLLVFENAPIDAGLLQKKRALNITYEKNRTHTNYPITVVVIPGLKLN